MPLIKRLLGPNPRMVEQCALGIINPAYSRSLWINSISQMAKYYKEGQSQDTELFCFYGVNVKGSVHIA